MGSARDDILARVRAALRDVPRDEDATGEGITRAYRRQGDPDVDRLGRFAERVADYRATVHRVAPDALAGAVASALDRRAARRVVVPADLPADWLAATDAEAVRDHGALTATELDGMHGVVTGCAVGIAETGTIVLDAGDRQGRRALSLVPDYHLCVVFADQVVASVPEAVARLDPRRPLTWVSGPSATSDIELDRVEGVHGPRTLEVLLVRPDA
ncbi:MAG TPA: LUD domain-containing protein [Streptosporangiales bacterium]